MLVLTLFLLKSDHVISDNTEINQIFVNEKKMLLKHKQQRSKPRIQVIATDSTDSADSKSENCQM